MTKPVILHTHIFKNAGTTFDFTLERNFKSNAIKYDKQNSPAHILEDFEILDVVKNNPSLQSLSSHQMRFQIPKVEGYNLLPVAFLRQPADRILSIYEFLKREKRNLDFNLLARNLNAKEFFEETLVSDGLLNVRNHQTRHFSRRDMKVVMEKVDLEKAKIVIENECFFVGIVERMDASLSLFSKNVYDRFFQTLISPMSARMLTQIEIPN